MTVPQLKKPEVSADRVERFGRFNDERVAEPRRNRPGLGPAFEMCFAIHSTDKVMNLTCMSFPSASSKATLRSAPNLGLPA